MKINKKIITISIEKVLLDLIEKDSLKRVLEARSIFLNQLIRKHYGFPNSIETWEYSDKEIKENESLKNKWLEDLKK